MQTLRSVLVPFTIVSALGAIGCEPPVHEDPPLPCPPGHHVELICDDVIALEGGTHPDDCGGECYEQCVPDSACPEGSYEQWVCEDVVAHGGDDVVCQGEGCTPGCYLTCVPIETCPPNHHEEWICVEPPVETDEAPSSGGATPGAPSQPPPEECYLECVPNDPCPEDTVAQTVCGESFPPQCWTECVPEPWCEPSLLCGDALSCFGGLLYPTTCGPENCDEPIGECSEAD
jgi:hypothetical protein